MRPAPHDLCEVPAAGERKARKWTAAKQRAQAQNKPNKTRPVPAVGLAPLRRSLAGCTSKIPQGEALLGGYRVFAYDDLVYKGNFIGSVGILPSSIGLIS